MNSGWLAGQRIHPRRGPLDASPPCRRYLGSLPISDGNSRAPARDSSRATARSDKISNATFAASWAVISEENTSTAPPEARTTRAVANQTLRI